MIILEKPFVSDFLQQTIINLNIPVLKTEYSTSLKYASQMHFIEHQEFIDKIGNQSNPTLYSNSENSGVWLNELIPEATITQVVNKLKDKAFLRSMFTEFYPDFWFKTCTIEELFSLDIDSLPTPFVIKPKRGFASICIYAIFNNQDWTNALQNIRKEIKEMSDVFPDKVVSLQEFILEKYITGKELAIDSYFDSDGNPVILSILTHLHATNYDMSDRLYISSEKIIKQYIKPITNYLIQINQILNLKNFPFHLEMIATEDNQIFPIEINAMRFMGFCVADADFLFYGINPYEYYINSLKPDWETILCTRENKIFGFMVIDIPKHLDRNNVIFNYEKFIQHFTKPLLYTKMDYKILPMSIIMFAEVDEQNFEELKYILESDIMEFLEIT